jgi:hypothetical protein
MPDKTKTKEISESPVPGSRDRRLDPRYKFTALAKVVEKASGAQFDLRVSDLGSRGCFLNADKPFPIGTNVSVRIVKGTKSFQADARVVFSSPGKGMGLFFTDVDPAQTEILAEWVAASMETTWLVSTRRQSQRLLLRLPVGVAGKDASGSPFEEKAYTQAVSAHGALILLAAPVNRGQRLTLTNERERESLECIVAHIGDAQEDLIQVGVSFVMPNPKFWKVTFPPEDWSIRHPDAKSKTGARTTGKE